MNSEIETYRHIDTVRKYLSDIISELLNRQNMHDKSKLEEPEKSILQNNIDKLKTSEYGSDEYKMILADMKPMLDHHYENNRHHPEHYTPLVLHHNIVREMDGMNLIDLIEMLSDWKAATLRHDSGKIENSIEINQKRFGYSDELKIIFKNTIDYLKWNSNADRAV